MQLPQAFIDRTAPLLGDSFEDFVNALQDDVPVSIRINPSKTNDTPQLEKVPWCSTGYYLPERPNFTLDPFLHAGTYYVQEASSMFLEQVVTQHINEPLCMLDLCAAPGGKSTHLISLLPKDSLLVSNEYVRSRAYILAENLQKWGNLNVVVSNNTPNEIGALEGFFDAILVDAPCSGEGMFRKDPDTIQEWSVANVTNCVTRQQDILEAVWPSLKENGILVYSTCTYNRAENEERVAWICEHLGAEILPIALDVNWGITLSDGGYRFYPHKTKGEGFFMAVLRKTAFQNEMRIKTDKHKTNPTQSIHHLANYLLDPKQFELNQLENKVQAFPIKFALEMQFLQKKLKLIQNGLPVAELKGKDWIPSPALAFSNCVNKDNFLQVEVDYLTALAYLRTENIHLPDVEKGFVLVCYKGYPLGWVKNLGNRCNSLFPSEWRIRMQIPKDLVVSEIIKPSLSSINI